MRQRLEEQEEKEKTSIEAQIPEWVGIDWHQIEDSNSDPLHIDAINPAKKRLGNLPKPITEKLKVLPNGTSELES